MYKVTYTKVLLKMCECNLNKDYCVVEWAANSFENKRMGNEIKSDQ